MRTPHRLMAALVAVAGFALAGANTASAQSVQLSSCSSWSIVGGVFSCTPINNGGGGNTATAPAACTVNVSPSSGAAGAAVGVSVSCSSGTQPFTYSWSGGFMQGSTAQAGSGQPTATTTFSVTVSNSAGSTSASGTYTVQTNSNPPPNNNGNGGGDVPGGISCTGYTTMVVNAAWPTSGVTARTLSNSVGSFTNGVALVVKFTTGAKGGFGRITAAEWGSTPTPKTAVLSATPCDFGQQASPYAFQQGVTVSTNFSVGPNSWGYPQLNANQTYYLNIKNEVDGRPTCSTGSCDVFIDLKSP